jgi:predicted RNase H-like nuclease (RuvC/YqgF family)
MLSESTSVEVNKNALEDRLVELRSWVTALNQRVACSVHGLGDRNIAKLREATEDLTYEIEQIQKQLTAQSLFTSELMDSVADLKGSMREMDSEINTLRSRVMDLEIESIDNLDRPIEVKITEAFTHTKITTAGVHFSLLARRMSLIAASCCALFFTASVTAVDGAQKQSSTDFAVPAGMAAIGFLAISWATEED